MSVAHARVRECHLSEPGSPSEGSYFPVSDRRATSPFCDWRLSPWGRTSKGGWRASGVWLPIRAGFTDLGVGSAGSALIAAIIASIGNGLSYGQHPMSAIAAATSNRRNGLRPTAVDVGRRAVTVETLRDPPRGRTPAGLAESTSTCDGVGPLVGHPSVGSRR
jgi:hypothetical protein